MPELIQITGTGQLLELRRRLRAAGGPRLQQNFSRRIRRAAEPLKNDMEQRIRTLHVWGKPHPHRKPESNRPGRGAGPHALRAAVASGLRIQIHGGSDPGARIWLDRSGLPFPTAPEKLNDGHWRHPTFGNRHVWVSQFSRPVGFWRKTVAKHEPRMRAEVERVLNDVKNMLD